MTDPSVLPPTEGGVSRGSPNYRRLTLAMLFAGFSTFSMLYSVQPLPPLLASAYRLSAAAASLAVSATTGPLESSVGSAMGLYVAGTALGGMGGRVMASLIADFGGWRMAVGAVGMLGLFMAEKCFDAWRFRRGASSAVARRLLLC